MIRATSSNSTSRVDRKSPRDLLTLDRSQIWTGSQVTQLRAEARRLNQGGGDQSVAIDLSRVRYLPSGFFGCLCELRDLGVTVRLFSPCEQIRSFEWFRRFFKRDRGLLYRFRDQPRYMTNG